MSPEQPAEFAGEYYSNELQVTYKVVPEKGRLVLKTPIRSKYLMELTGITGEDTLKQIEKDKFRFAFLFLDFNRKASGKISGFTLIHERAGLRIKFSKN